MATMAIDAVTDSGSGESGSSRRASAMKPAPKPADMAHDLITSTAEADLPKLAMSDRSLSLQTGRLRTPARCGTR